MGGGVGPDWVSPEKGRGGEGEGRGDRDGVWGVDGGGDPRRGISLSRSSSQKWGLSMVVRRSTKQRPRGVPPCVVRGGVEGLGTNWLLVLGCGEQVSM